MDRRERSGEANTTMLAVLQGWQANIQTALPGIIQSFDPTKRTVVVQPTVQAQARGINGETIWLTLPLLLDCPVFFPGGGGVTLTFPIKPGDECLIVFANRCIDNWWASGLVSQQADLRMHDLSDGFCLAGVSSVPKVIPGISTTTAQLRDDPGTTFIELDPLGNVNVATPGNVTVTTGGTITATAAGGATITAPTITIMGNVNVTGSITATGDITAGLVSLKTHTHPDPDGGDTGPPN